MNIKTLTAVSLGLSLLLSTSTVLAQSSPDSIPASPDGTLSPSPDETMTPESQPDAASPEETITPDSTAPADATESDTNIGGVEGSDDADGIKLVACGPNGAAIRATSVRPGCHHLKVNSPPGVQ
ncbi:hypothetical protein [Acaryochloris sp. IP29b_bin.148]|uniref:hypothetical protein n=1 Tax=Acaryochloris sp. IP29b_bin.148 TaxID=2969218 RepID=UPI0026064439|nr:hypothetical protein [Acaryochloris sp. IP29b_bin.148]